MGVSGFILADRLGRRRTRVGLGSQRTLALAGTKVCAGSLVTLCEARHMSLAQAILGQVDPNNLQLELSWFLISDGFQRGFQVAKDKRQLGRLSLCRLENLIFYASSGLIRLPPASSGYCNMKCLLTAVVVAVAGHFALQCGTLPVALRDTSHCKLERSPPKSLKDRGAAESFKGR
ncbi:hypothetical protein PhaeoP97_01742 [Phaeobacter porticola]|uniref:Uncharacterized protein n=1 Tax=Phaeobacter porticola TaxID=1844006 RepID=A0A1L3I500_9RHOB|nr:hypothetical protein PhaeoP97_01742 [Phaeobacter porticola]